MTHWWWVARQRIILTLLKKYLKGDKNVILDGGCGTGAGMFFLSKLGRVYGVDLSPRAVEFCKERGLKTVKLGDISRLPYRDNYFDLVCLMDVIEHIEKDRLAIKEARRVLKPGGIILVTMPALPFIYSNHDKEQGHFRRYSKKELDRLFKNSGFKNLKITYFNILLSPPIIFIRLTSKLGGPFARLADFDSRLNYDVAKKKKINFLLTEIFSLESLAVKLFDIPFGVSLLTIREKK